MLKLNKIGDWADDLKDKTVSKVKKASNSIGDWLDKTYNNKETASILKTPSTSFNSSTLLAKNTGYNFSNSNKTTKPVYKQLPKQYANQADYEKDKRKTTTVENIQKSLNTLGYKYDNEGELKVDGEFGAKTQKVWNKFIENLGVDNHLYGVANNAIPKNNTFQSPTLPNKFTSPKSSKKNTTNLTKDIFAKPLLNSEIKLGDKLTESDSKSLIKVLDFAIPNSSKSILKGNDISNLKAKKLPTELTDNIINVNQDGFIIQDKNNGRLIKVTETHPVVIDNDSDGIDVFMWIDNVVDFFKADTNVLKGEFDSGLLHGEGKLVGGFSENNSRFQLDAKSNGEKGRYGLFGKISGGNASGKIGVGDDDLSISLKGVADGLTATANVGGIYEDGLGFSTGAVASLLAGRATAELEIFGWELEAGVSGNLGSFGGEIKAGYFPKEGFTAKAKAAAGIGGGFVIRVKPPQK